MSIKKVANVSEPCQLMNGKLLGCILHLHSKKLNLHVNQDLKNEKIGKELVMTEVQKVKNVMKNVEVNHHQHLKKQEKVKKTRMDFI